MALVLGTNSYTDIAGANLYFRDNLQNTTWTVLTSTVKSQALVTASTQISLFVKQDCKLPIVGVVPTSLINATAELALSMATTASVITQANTGSNVKRVQAGSAEVEFFRPQRGLRFPSLVLNYLKDGDCIDGATVTGAIATGASEQSTFTDRNPYGLTEGYP